MCRSFNVPLAKVVMCAGHVARQLLCRRSWAHFCLWTLLYKVKGVCWGVEAVSSVQDCKGLRPIPLR